MRFGVVGNTHGGETVYYMQLDQNGNVLATFGYNLSFITANNWHVRGIYKLTESVDGNYIYVMGQVLGPNTINQDVDFFILKIEVATGNLVWSNIYDFGYTNAGSMDWAYDLIESPYLTPNGTELIVVGMYGDVAPSILDGQGFILRVDAFSGSPFGNAEIYKSTLPHVDYEYFSSIAVANSPAAGGFGFIVAGNTADGATLRNDPSDIWSVKMDPIGNILWQNAYSSATLDGDFATDVIERFNPNTGQYEYYYGGYTKPGSTSRDDDILVIKTDELGNVFPNGQMMFDWLEESRSYELDQFNNAGPNNLNGLSIYANTYGVYAGTTQLMHIKTYFNGYMECNDWRETPLQFPGPGHVGSVTVSTPGDFMPTPWGPLSVTVRPSVDQNSCFNMTVPGGSNARVAPAKPKGEQQSTITPNPMAQGVEYAKVNVEVEQAGTAQIRIYDMLGRTYFSQNLELAEGENNVLLDLSKANMAAGMYTVRIESQSINKSIVLLVK
jgi:hypothetical protein